MSLLTIVVTLVVIGVIMYLVLRFIPMEDTIRQILVAVVVIVVILWLLRAFGVLGDLQSIRVGN